MIESIFDHDRLDVNRSSIEYTAGEHSLSGRLKAKLKCIVSMLTKMAMKFDGVSESATGCAVDVDCEHEHEHRDAEHEHRDAEHEHEHEDSESEPSVAYAGRESASIKKHTAIRGAAVPRSTMWRVCYCHSLVATAISYVGSTGARSSMMRISMLLLAAWLVLQTTAGCTLTKKDQPRSLNEWGKLSRPKF